MAENVPLGGEIAGDALDAEGFDTIDVGDDDLGAFGGIAAADFFRDRGGVDEGVVEDGAAGVLVDALDVLGGGEVRGSRWPGS